MNILGTGLSGLVGSRIVELNHQHQFTDLSLDSGFDILNPDTLEKVFAENPAEVVLHLAAFTDTNAAWSQKGDTSGLCYQLNVIGTQIIANLCRKYGKHLIHISTDFVFDGTKTSAYTEEDTPHPLDWYGETKFAAEKIAQDFSSTIVRIAYPYRAKFDQKIDLVRKILTKLQNNEVVTLFTDQITTPTFIDDIALGIDKLITFKPIGIYHLVGSSSQSPYELAKLIAQTFNLNPELVKPSSLSEYLQTPNARPFAQNSELSNKKFISEFNFIPKTTPEGLLALLNQM